VGHGDTFSSGGAPIDNEADETLNEVLEHLKADDFRVLRKFQGKAKLTTYLTTIISNLAINRVRKRNGRSRAKERAMNMGDVAERLYEAVYGRGYSLGEAHGFLNFTWGIAASYAELGVMLDRMRGRDDVHHQSGTGECWPPMGKEVVTGEGIEIVIPDPSRSADEVLADDQRERFSRRVLDGVLEELSGEERVILTLRFPIDDCESPKANREIAEMLDLTEKAVDNRVRRILNRCRQMILSQGLSLGDLIDVGK
jgi:RNA polymerase sigma factor (sigma-70 family)